MGKLEDKGLTKRQEEILWQLDRWQKSNPAALPTYRELSPMLGLSQGGVNYQLKQLTQKGYIKRTGHVTGGEIIIVKRFAPDELIDIPISGVVCNELVMLFESPIGIMKVTPAVAQNRELFAMKLVDSHSPDGDAVLLFRKWQLPNHASTVLVEHEGRLLIGKLKITETNLWLAPRFSPEEFMKILPGDSLRFIAMLLATSRNGELLYQ